MSARSPTASMRPSLTSRAPSCRGGDEMGIRVPAAKITGPAWLSGISPDHLRGYGLQELAFGANGQEVEVFEGRVDLTPGPLLGPGDSVRGEHSFYACLDQLRCRTGVCEDAPDLLRIPFAQGEDDRQRHGALDEVRAYALAHKPRLAYEVHYVVRHLEGYAKSLSVAGEHIYLHEREPAKRSAGHARSLEQACGLLPYVLQVRLDVDRRPEQDLLPGLPHACAQHQEQRPETFPP